MNQTIERILNEQFDYEKEGLNISVSGIELELRSNQLYTGSFNISGRSGSLTEGHIYCNDLRLELITDYFCGQSEEIGYNFSAVGLEGGDIVKGEIYIVSNRGEYYIPYSVSIRPEEITSSIGVIKNLFHFANLAKTRWDEAVKLFYSDSFINIFTGSDRNFITNYLGLQNYYGNEQNVEEFLISINKKQPIEYIIGRDSVVADEPEGLIEESIDITRNGWGYTFLQVDCDADFVILQKTEITEDDFLGNFFSYSFLIDSDRLHNGVNYATLTFYNSFARFEVKVTASKDKVEKHAFAKNIELERNQYDLMTYYEAFRTRKIDVNKWMAESKQIVDRMIAANPGYLPGSLFRAQLLIFEERYNEAKWLLDQAENTFNETQDYSSAAWAYYLYLTTLCNRDEAYIDEITMEVENIYAKDPSEWRVAWLLLYLSEEFAVSPSRKWVFIEEQMQMKCNSPMLFVEAVNMLLINPTLLTKLGEYEVRVLRYAARNELLNDDLRMQFVYLAGRERTFRKPVFEILLSCYAAEQSDEILRTICELLIKGDCFGEEYFEYFHEAIIRELKITRLYEQFIKCLDLEKEYDIPKMVFMYFSYENSLDSTRAAYIYSRIISRREEFPELFETYKSRMSRFAVDSILEERINRDYAVIYRFFLNEIVLTDEIACRLSKLIFTHRITVTDSNITKVVVYQMHECIENTYPVVNGVAYVPIYSKEYTILLEDVLSNRYLKSAEFSLEKLIAPGKIAALLMPRVHGDLAFDVYACESSSDMFDISDDNRERYSNIMHAPQIDMQYKSDIRVRMLGYYFDTDDVKTLDELLEDIDVHSINRRERIRDFRYLVQRGMFDKALAWVTEFGLEGIEPKDLVKLCSRLILRSDYAPDTTLLRFASAIFNIGKYDDVILRYLVENYNGMTRDMRKVYNAALNFDVEVGPLCERMLVQLLETGYYFKERMDVYRRYLQYGSKLPVQEAFIAQCAYDYFVKEQLMENFIFEEITRLKLKGENILTVCKLAYLQYYSEHRDSAGPQILIIIREFLDDLMGKGIYMSFFKEFLEKASPAVNRFSDKTIVEYKTAPGRKVLIHYIIESDGDESGEYITEEMADMYGGVHAKAFVLFFGENLLYYITEQCDDEELLTESASISKSDIGQDISGTRFDQINDIVIAKTLQDYDAVNDMMYEYHKHDYVVNKFFKLM